ncbi:MAG: ECF transporter S component [Spirochaetota bacterium]
MITRRVGVFRHIRIWEAKDIAVVAVFSGLVFVLTMVAIPMPVGGYWHFGNVMIMIAALLFGPLVGGLCGMIGATLADLVLGYGMWAPFTFWIKFVNGVVAGYLFLPAISRGKLDLKACWPTLVVATVLGYASNVLLYVIPYWILLDWPAVVGWLAGSVPSVAYEIGAPIVIVIAAGKAFPRIFGYRESVRTRYDLYRKRRKKAPLE